ncbi:EVE domain-containing protein [Novosphingobium sp. KCTC 2891]|uniref:EVE domain-containing protein n=1 Tax=Novosphingobium sp. KCTC 2891 TaxID=2989730 RepID=UPI0022220A24|nr:EVE domain-containing protein [Novosphingobium sp. KCTC 2891]MCW1382850.1 EVE domain-containing protein [Novosphingobium sp. KCTC 2891]
MTKINVADTAGRQLWLMKSEPDVYSYDDLVAEGEGTWDGVRNHLAARNLRTMQVGDLAFFYHSNIGKEIVGVATISEGGITDPTDPEGKWAAVKVKPVAKVRNPVTLKTIKATEALADMDLLRLSRLSVSSVRPEEWALLLDMAGGTI